MIRQSCCICKKKFRCGPLLPGPRVTCSRICGEENERRTKKDWYNKNRELCIKRAADWMRNNPEKVRLSVRKSELKYRIQRNKRSEIYRKKYPEKVALSQRKQYLKDIELRSFLSKLYRSRQKLIRETLKSMNLTVPSNINPLTVLKELGIDVTQIMENVNVD